MNRLVFVVEGDTSLRHSLRDHLEQQGYSVCAFSTVAGIIAEAEESHPSLFLISTALGRGDGLKLCARIRGNLHIGQTPVLLLSPAANEDELVNGFELGADDYINLLRGLPEIAARVKAVLRRFDRTASVSAVEAGPLQLDRISMTLSIAGRSVPLSVTEFRLLDHLVRHPGRVFTRDQILDAVWGDGNFVTPATINTHVGRLRGKIEPHPGRPQYLKTVHGVGYRFDLPAGKRGVGNLPFPTWDTIPPQPADAFSRRAAG